MFIVCTVCSVNVSIIEHVGPYLIRRGNLVKVLLNLIGPNTNRY